jgi:hypothetical protein
MTSALSLVAASITNASYVCADCTRFRTEPLISRLNKGKEVIKSNGLRSYLPGFCVSDCVLTTWMPCPRVLRVRCRCFGDGPLDGLIPNLANTLPVRSHSCIGRRTKKNCRWCWVLRSVRWDPCSSANRLAPIVHVQLTRQAEQEDGNSGSRQPMPRPSLGSREAFFASARAGLLAQHTGRGRSSKTNAVSPSHHQSACAARSALERGSKKCKI